MATEPGTIAEIQTLLGVKPDGIWGPLSAAALDAAILRQRSTNPPPVRLGPVHHVRATSFADPADVAAFRRCKADGKSDDECFKVGDNGIGFWGDDTTTLNRCICALPPEDMVERWGSVAAARGKQVLVTANGKQGICQLLEKMPSRRHIENGAGLDLSPGACFYFGLTPPVFTPATWQWVE